MASRNMIKPLLSGDAHPSVLYHHEFFVPVLSVDTKGAHRVHFGPYPCGIPFVIHKLKLAPQDAFSFTPNLAVAYSQLDDIAHIRGRVAYSLPGSVVASKESN
jgi:hypothetical protein